MIAFADQEFRRAAEASFARRPAGDACDLAAAPELFRAAAHSWWFRCDAAEPACLARFLTFESLGEFDADMAVLAANRYLCGWFARRMLGASARRRALEALASAASFVGVVLVRPEEAAQTRVHDPVSLASAQTECFLGVTAAAPRRPFAISAEVATRRAAPIIGLTRLRFSQLSLESAGLRCEPALAQAQEDLFMIEHSLVLAAIVLGIARNMLRYALDYVRSRSTFGKAIGQHQAVALKLADILSGYLSARLLWLEFTRLDPGSPARPRAAQRAWRNLEATAGRLAIDCVQLLGGHGYLSLHPMEAWLRDLMAVKGLNGAALESECADAGW
jgi:hypothetical protein